MLDPLKDVIRLVGLPDPALHALLGMVILVLAAALFRRPLGSWVPWLSVLAIQLINEAADVARDLLDGEVLRWRGSLLDTAVTMFLPTLLLFYARWRSSAQRRAKPEA